LQILKVHDDSKRSTDLDGVKLQDFLLHDGKQLNNAGLLGQRDRKTIKSYLELAPPLMMRIRFINIQKIYTYA